MSESESSESNSDANISRLREMAIRGQEYRKSIDFTYYDMEGTLYVRPLTDPEFLPVAAFLEDRLDMDTEEAQEALEEGKDPETDTIDPSQFDDEFVSIMADVAVLGIDSEQGIAEGETEEGLREILGVDEEGNLRDDGIGLQGGKTLVIAKEILEISSDADKAEAFRRDGGGE